MGGQTFGVQDFLQEFPGAGGRSRASGSCVGQGRPKFVTLCKKRGY
ncbi:hypothetical protein ACS15_1214 [Ralstonia insidiosa]|uniref:Uncharacterized protein n=1 Tax=Ralstonia insidiosa TaxID=190721 RepID=A0AAC9FPL8_9RALS|nr:hypothetical protein ACS15_1214 [Ralstonia insidiosa]